MKQKIILAIVKELVKYLDGYHLSRNGGKKTKKAETVETAGESTDMKPAESVVH